MKAYRHEWACAFTDKWHGSMHASRQQHTIPMNGHGSCMETALLHSHTTA